MHLSHVKIENFRVFGDSESGTALDLRLNPGLNLIVGENESGKSALIDAIRLLLGTRDYEWFRWSRDEFHIDEKGNRAKELLIEGRFDDLDEEEASRFLEWLGVEPAQEENASPSYFLRIRLDAKRKEPEELGRFDREISVVVRAGPDENGIRMDTEARDLLRATYLKPLRDAEQELAAKRGSRLSQILLAHPEIKARTDDITGIIDRANREVRDQPFIQERVASLNEEYLSYFILAHDPIRAIVDIADVRLRDVLERLRMLLSDRDEPEESTQHGLGLNNLLFMAAELLLLQSPSGPAAPVVLIEEPEAHLHPQYQLRLVEFLERQTQPQTRDGGRPIQVVMTSHSPNLASKIDLEHLVIMHKGQAYPMASEYTKLDKSDYDFLRRFLDVTKANLFFARGVLIVEGNAEQILLPTMAKLIGRPLSRYGVSIINVGHSGLFRYAHVFQRKDGGDMGVRVACITDLDIPPGSAKEYLNKYQDGNVKQKTSDDLTPEQQEEVREHKRNRPGGAPTRTFVSPQWTLEYDIAASGLALRMHVAIQLAKTTSSDLAQVVCSAVEQYRQWKNEGKSTEEIATLIYQPLYEKKGSKAETAQHFARLLESSPRNSLKLPSYLIDAINYATCKDLEPDKEADHTAAR